MLKAWPCVAVVIVVLDAVKKIILKFGDLFKSDFHFILKNRNIKLVFFNYYLFK